MSEYKFASIVSIIIYAFEYAIFRALFALRDVNNATHDSTNAIMLATLRYCHKLGARFGNDWQTRFGAEPDLIVKFENNKPLPRPHFEVHLRT